MTEISATEASKRFADLLDAVEHRGETFTLLRRGRPIATVSPARPRSLKELRAFVRSHPPDERWAADLDGTGFDNLPAVPYRLVG